MRIQLFVLSVVLVFSLKAQKLEVEEFTSLFREKNAKIRSITCDFKQVHDISVFPEPQLSSGKFYYRYPEKIKWEQLLPSKNYFVFNGNDVFISDGTKVEKANNPQTLGFRKFFIGMMDGSIFTSDEFESTFTKVGNSILVELSPQKKIVKSQLEKISFSFDADTLLLKEFTFYEVGGDKRTATLFNHQINTLVDDGAFK
jgi:outer membrane lipoprotein-sorting protein